MGQAVAQSTYLRERQRLRSSLTRIDREDRPEPVFDTVGSLFVSRAKV